MAKVGLLVLASLAFLVSASRGQDQPLKVASILSAPYLKLKSNDSLTGTKDDYEGFIKDLLDELGHDYELVIPDDTRYGRLDPETGTWTGTVGMALDGKADLIATDLTINSPRLEVLDFSVPFMASRLTVVAKLGSGAEWPLVVSPFSWVVWVLLLVAYLVASLVFFLVKRISPHERVWSVNKARSMADITFNESLWILVASFFHGSKPPATACSSRLLLCGWWLFGVAIVAAYAANLGTIWTLIDGQCVQKSRYDSVEEMLDNPDFKFMLFQHGATHQLMKTSSDPLHRRVYERIMEHEDDSFINTQLEGVEKLDDPEADVSNVGLLMEGSAADFLKPRHCGFYSVGQLDERSYALAFPKGSELTKKFSTDILRLTESGKLHEIKSRWWDASEGDSCSDKSTAACEGLEPLELKHIDGPFIFLAVVLLVALVFSVVELLCYSCDKKEPGITWKAIFGRDLKEGCCGCLPVAGHQAPAKKTADEA